MKVLKQAFKITLPVLFGYLVLGMAFGLLLQKAGYNFLWAIFISIIVYAGSMQFVLVSFLESGINLIAAALTTLSVNSRHIFYGLSFLEKFNKMGKKKWYMIFSLTDETYSLLCSLKSTDNIDENQLMFNIALLNHLYWIAGCTLGAGLGQIIPINTAGVEFSMTALFLVIFIDQWKNYKSHLPVYIGSVCGVLSLMFFGASGFILPALFGSVILLFVFRKIIVESLVGEGNELDD